MFATFFKKARVGQGHFTNEELPGTLRAILAKTSYSREVLVLWVCLKIVYPYTQWLMIIIPIKWL